MISETSDELTVRAQRALQESPVYVLRQLTVERHEERLLITGQVTSYYQKQQAQETVRAVAKGVAVVNSVEVGLNDDLW